LTKKGLFVIIYLETTKEEAEKMTELDKLTEGFFICYNRLSDKRSDGNAL
jgi:hypothetical protein